MAVWDVELNLFNSIVNIMLALMLVRINRPTHELLWLPVDRHGAALVFCSRPGDIYRLVLAPAVYCSRPGDGWC